MLTRFSHADGFWWQDVGAARDDVARYLGQHELSLIGRSTMLDATGWARRLRNVSVMDLAYGREVQVAVPAQAETFFLIVISLAGAGVIRNGQYQIGLRPGTVTAVDPAKPMRARLSADHASRFVRIEQSRCRGFAVV